MRVGRGSADITGEVVGGELLGYGKADQIATGLHQRLRARALVFEDDDGGLVLLVVNDLGMVFDSVHREVLRRLSDRFGGRYHPGNVLLTATHTHGGCGGHSHHLLYILGGYHPATYEAVVAGMVEAVERADADLAPGTVHLAHGELTDASVNRSPSAFARNPAAERAFFPDGIDPQTTTLRLERDGATVGLVNFFATHGTSMSNTNTLVTGDNKGYAAWLAERWAPGAVCAFAQTNAGDMSPNLNRAPGSGPTGDEVTNTVIIGGRQTDAATAGAADPAARPITGPVTSRRTTIDLTDFEVAPAFTGDGRPHRTRGPSGGAAALAGTEEGPGFWGFHQGRGANPLWEALSNRIVYRLSPATRDAHAPKAIVVPGNPFNRSAVPLVQERVPVQLVRLGPLWLIGIPGEVTIVAGLRLRRAVAEVVGAPVADVIVVGYANAYIHYVTTPEEYNEQRYEGGSTLYGRFELGALTQTAVAVAAALIAGEPAPIGPEPPDLSGHRRPPARRRPRGDEVAPGRRFGDVVVGPRSGYAPGEQVRVSFVGAHPNNDLHRGGTYTEVQQEADGGWRTVADDADWATTFRWAPDGRHRSVVTLTWDVPAGTTPGRYRLRYRGDAADRHGRLEAFVGVTAPFAVYQPMVPGSPLNGPTTQDVTQPP